MYWKYLTFFHMATFIYAKTVSKILKLYFMIKIPRINYWVDKLHKGKRQGKNKVGGQRVRNWAFKISNKMFLPLETALHDHWRVQNAVQFLYFSFSDICKILDLVKRKAKNREYVKTCYTWITVPNKRSEHRAFI